MTPIDSMKSLYPNEAFSIAAADTEKPNALPLFTSLFFCTIHRGLNFTIAIQQTQNINWRKKEQKHWQTDTENGANNFSWMNVRNNSNCLDVVFNSLKLSLNRHYWQLSVQSESEWEHIVTVHMYEVWQFSSGVVWWCWMCAYVCMWTRKHTDKPPIISD